MRLSPRKLRYRPARIGLGPIGLTALTGVISYEERLRCFVFRFRFLAVLFTTPGLPDKVNATPQNGNPVKTLAPRQYFAGGMRRGRDSQIVVVGAFGRALIV